MCFVHKNHAWKQDNVVTVLKHRKRFLKEIENSGSSKQISRLLDSLDERLNFRETYISCNKITEKKYIQNETGLGMLNM